MLGLRYFTMLCNNAEYMKIGKTWVCFSCMMYRTKLISYTKHWLDLLIYYDIAVFRLLVNIWKRQGRRRPQNASTSRGRFRRPAGATRKSGSGLEKCRRVRRSVSGAIPRRRRWRRRRRQSLSTRNRSGVDIKTTFFCVADEGVKLAKAPVLAKPARLVSYLVERPAFVFIVSSSFRRLRMAQCLSQASVSSLV
jgi:hypothetical protein